MRLWKYVGKDRIDILSNGLIRFTPPALTNDPFEAFPAIAELVEVARSQDPFNERVSLGPLDLALEIAEVDGRPLLQDWITELLGEVIRRRFGMLCLCQEPHHPLMWAHYAENHTGFAIEFETEHPYFEQSIRVTGIGGVAPVRYTSDRPHFSSQSWPDVMFTKHDRWAYEREWRLVRPSSEAQDTQKFLHKYPRETVKRVICGARVERQTLEDLRSVVSTVPLLKGVPIHFAVPDLGSYEFKIEEAPPKAAAIHISGTQTVEIRGGPIKFMDQRLALGPNGTPVVTTERNLPVPVPGTKVTK